MYENDHRIVMTLDAGGTNFVFSAIQGCREIVSPIRMNAVSDDIDRCLDALADGFRKVEELLPEKPLAISFAFPGPADYANGIIGDLPNFPCFRGGVAMGPFLSETFGIPVFINNDGNLFAYGEALVGKLTEINSMLAESGSTMRYRNIVGLTFGTGFGAGVVLDGKLLDGDNGCGGDVWCMRNSLYPEMIAEESVSIRAVRRVYSELAEDDVRDLSPKEIFDIAEGLTEGNRVAAIRSFKQLGHAAADALTSALDIVDGIVVIGGGLSGAHKYIIPSMVERMNSSLRTFAGDKFPYLQSEVFDLTDRNGLEAFLKDESTLIKVPKSNKTARYRGRGKTGIAVSSIGTSTAIALGAYTFALSNLDN